MIQNTLSNLGGVGIYGVLSVCLFVAVFTVALVWALRLKKSYLNSMRDLPLDDSTNQPTKTFSNTKTSHE